MKAVEEAHLDLDVKLKVSPNADRLFGSKLESSRSKNGLQHQFMMVKLLGFHQEIQLLNSHWIVLIVKESFKNWKSFLMNYAKCQCNEAIYSRN